METLIVKYQVQQAASSKQHFSMALCCTDQWVVPREILGFCLMSTVKLQSAQVLATSGVRERCSGARQGCQELHVDVWLTALCLQAEPGIG